MENNPIVLTLRYSYNGSDQTLYPTVLFGENDAVLIDCGYPGSLDRLEAELTACGVRPERLTKLVLTHQDDDHMGAAAELKEAYPALQILASAVEAPLSFRGEEKPPSSAGGGPARPAPGQPEGIRQAVLRPPPAGPPGSSG